MNEQEKTLDTYARIGPARNSSHSNKELWRNEYESLHKLQSHGKILDIGCGAGRDAQLFVPARYDYIGCDASPEMIAAAKTRVPNAQFEVANVYALPYDDEEFDCIWSAATYLHIPKKDIVRTLHESLRVLKTGGHGVFMMKEGEGELMIANSFGERFFAFFTLEEFSEALETAGFSVIAQHAAINPLDHDQEHRYLRYIVQKQ